MISFKEQVERTQEPNQSVEILIRLLCAVPRWSEQNVQSLIWANRTFSHKIASSSLSFSHQKSFPVKETNLCLLPFATHADSRSSTIPTFSDDLLQHSATTTNLRRPAVFTRQSSLQPLQPPTTFIRQFLNIVGQFRYCSGLTVLDLP
ncbi:hypothetical protein Vadar_025595 [Vaccinium darrowii]|uniref:Uncharacterized protein n=1 Tax=Vaccinium darrowii TaxID=229202 RepID=A0ACB7XUC7_9ERIC|nr:hypothetical protein Vadar_025595 [Vaccinium darrowii]